MNEVINKVLPFASNYPIWLQSTLVVVPIALAIAVAYFVIMNSNKKITPVLNHILTTPLSESVSDKVIYGVLQDLNALTNSSKRPSDAQLVKALTPLFSRAAFLDIREESWDHFLYVLFLTRVILAEYAGNFRNVTVRSKLGQVIIIMIRLQDDVADIYGPTFSINEHIELFGNNKEQFVGEFPVPIIEPDYEFIEARSQSIREIREILKPLGLTNW